MNGITMGIVTDIKTILFKFHSFLNAYKLRVVSIDSRSLEAPGVAPVESKHSPKTIYAALSLAVVGPRGG